MHSKTLFVMGFGIACALAQGCSSSSSSTAAKSAATTIDDGLPASCSPLRTKGACALPWPNAIYTTPDATTKTGVRLALTSDILPLKAGTGLLDPTRINKADGFSPGTPVLAYFNERIDVASLVAPEDPAKSLDPSAATILVDMETKKLVAHFSEIDLTVRQDEDRQGLMIRPLARLLPSHSYAVAITTSIKTTAGVLPTPPPLFASIADGNAPSDAMSQKQAARMPAILAALKGAGVERDKLVVAWDFVTASDEYVTSHMVSMRDQALADVGMDGGAFTITKIDDLTGTRVARRITGTFTVPQFISPADPTNPKAEISFDSAGKPMMQGHYEAPFEMIIPPLAKTKALPLMLFGHGLLGGADNLTDGSTMAQFAADNGYILFATDWIGLSHNENPIGGSNGAIGEALTDFNHLPWVTDRLQQALVNAMVLVRTVRGKLSKDPAMQMNGNPVADTSKIYYWGISLGGIMGGAFMGYDPDITQGVLGVAGGFWSLMMQRSSQWPQFELLIKGSYADYLDQQLGIAVTQCYFDFADPATAAPHTVKAPLAGVPMKQILVQMAVGDSQVPNLATMEMTRTEGIPLIGSTTLTTYGIDTAAGPAPSGLTIWDVHAKPAAPLTNVTPTSDNGAHGAIHALPKLQQQMQGFFTTGMITDTCGGPCSF